jgi:uncharacterized protein (DUF2384 family)
MSKSQPGKWWSDAKRVEVVTGYLILGKAPLVEAMTGVPAGTIRRWKQEPWFNEMVNQIQKEDDQELDAKLASRLSKALDIIDDRLTSGDYMFNPKTGEFTRRPVSMKDTWKTTKELVDLRLMLRKQPKEQAGAEAVGDILKGLAREFADMARNKVRSSEKLQVGIQELSGDISPEETPGVAECSPPIDGDSRPSA